MKNSELDKILKSAGVPQKSMDFWQQFPKKVLTQVRRLGGGGDACVAERATTGARRTWASVFPVKLRLPAVGFALACAVVAWLVISRTNPKAVTGETQIAQARQYYREIKLLFPNQLRGIVFDQQGAHLLLAEQANVPASPPVFV
jgi:hypothetical protein